MGLASASRAAVHTREDRVSILLIPQRKQIDCIGYNNIVDRAECIGYDIEKVGNNLG